MHTPPAMIDIGANLTNQRFHADLDAVLERAQQAGVCRIVVTGTSERASTEALALVRRYPAYLRCTAGVHPHDASSWNEASAAAIARLARQPEVVAVGECGLDYNRMFSPEREQLRCFEAQLALAVELQKPVFLHERDAHDAFFGLLKQYRPALKGAVVHCFTGTLAQMREYLDLDCHIGITGWVCDERRGDELREAVKYLPLDRLMIETDAPYLPPRHVRPKPAANRNEPMYLGAVLETVAAICAQPMPALAAQVRSNTEAFFGLG
ncbi:MAG: TatD family hydrolase [Pseudomonadota bacterium]